MGGEEESFTTRWSKRKEAARQEETNELRDEDQLDSAQQEGVSGVDNTEEELLTEEDFDDVDFDALDKSSDYTRFAKANVPAAIQKKALRKLWDSDSVFEVLDGMNDYDEDFTGNGLAGKVFKTAYKVGRGFLEKETEEVAEAEIDSDDSQEQIVQDEEADKTITQDSVLTDSDDQEQSG